MIKRGLLFGVLLCTLGCSTKPEEAPPEEEGIAVTVLQTTLEDVERTVHVVGKLKAVEHVTISSKVPGKLASYVVEKGARVEKGAIIATVERDEVGYSYKPAPLLSPISGVVTHRSLDVGDEVTPGLGVAQVMNHSVMIAEFSLPDHYASMIKKGQDLRLNIESSSIDTTISNVDPLIDPVQHTFSFETRIDNPNEAWLPGMVVKSDVVLERFVDTIILPEEAITAIEGEWSLYKVLGEHAHAQKVELGLRQAGRVHIIDGVDVGDEVVIEGHHKLTDGVKVKSRLL